jgi:hypothetical protein
MTNAPQGPGYDPDPPRQQPGQARPARFPAAAAQTVDDNPPAASAVGAANPRVAQSLLFAGFLGLFIAGFLPATANAQWGSGSGSGGGLNTGITAGCLGLVSLTFRQPKPRLWSLLTLTVLIAFLVLGQIVIFCALASLHASPGIGILVSAAAIVTLAVGIVVAWIAQANAES